VQYSSVLHLLYVEVNQISNEVEWKKKKPWQKGALGDTVYREILAAIKFGEMASYCLEKISGEFKI